MRQFIGMGTGRSGTMSLTMIARAAGMDVYHEHDGYPNEGQGGSYVDHLRKLAGDGTSMVGFPLLWLYHLLPKMPVVCLHRDKYDFVESAKRYLGPPSEKPSLPWLGEALSDRSEEYYGQYWDWAEGVMACVRAPVLHVSVKDLSGDLVCLSEFLRWNSIPEVERIWNSTK